MGICLSAEEKEQRARNKAIDDKIKKDKNALASEVKILILGTGESGKSTILKQMQLIHGPGYSETERLAFKEIIFNNTIQSIRVILQAMETMSLLLDKPEHEELKKLIMARESIEADVFPPDLANAVKTLWTADKGVQACFMRSREYQLNDSAKYYFESIDRIKDPNYVPTDQDVLRSRVKTTGIVETTFHVNELIYRMFDVGGQRSERKKWIHCFENVTAILFLVAISEYDQVLVEDETVNRMQEALTLFEQICNSQWFVKTSMILFLNKIDLFKDKLPRSPINQYFPNYGGDNLNYEQASAFFRDSFVALNRNPQKEVYTHFTCATDTSQIKFVMAAVNDIIVQLNLQSVGLV